MSSGSSQLPSYLAELNGQQREAVCHTDGPIMVIAGAGSGKTRVLTTKIAHLLSTQQATPDQILALTFTNKAAQEMRHRVSSMLNSGTQTLWLGTFHSVSVRLLRQVAHHIGFPSHFTIYDTEDGKSLLRQIIKELNLDDAIYKPASILSRISHAKNRMITAERYAQDHQYQAEDLAMRMPRLYELFLRYTRDCHSAAAMDFDDLLLHTHTILHQHPKVAHLYQNQFRYLFVDEFQDTNLVQYKIVQKLAALHQNICVVGDDAQSIYAFRGADIGNMLYFSKDYPSHKLFKLEQNYRSTQQIVQASNGIILNNQTQLKKQVWTNNHTGEPIGCIESSSDIEESRLVVGALLKTKEKYNSRYQDFAILYRTNSQSRHFEEALRKQHIPYQIISGLSFYQRKEVKDLLAYLRFVANPDEITSLRRIINLPKRGIGPVALQKLFSIAKEKKWTVWHVLSQTNHFFTGAIASALTSFTKVITQARALSEQGNNAYQVATFLAKESGLLHMLYEDKTVEGTTRQEHTQELLNSIKQFTDQPSTTSMGLADFLQDIALMTQQEESDQLEDQVTLMTIHASKGMEFNYVYLVGMEEGLFPSPRMVGSQTDLEEERRLFYVAVTRAKLYVTLSCAKIRYQFGKLHQSKPSRFLKEIDTNTKIGSLEMTKTKPTSTALTLAVGMQVGHHHFGTGTIVELDQDNGKALIHFAKVGRKTLLLKYAKLKPLSS